MEDEVGNICNIIRYGTNFKTADISLGQPLQIFFRFISGHSVFDLTHSWMIFEMKLKFYGPVNTVKAKSSRSVNLPTLLFF